MRTPEHNAKIAAALRGKPKSPEHRRRLSEVRKGKQLGATNPNWRGGEWGEHKREKYQVHNAANLARRHGVENSLTLTEWLEVLEEFGWSCAYCLRPTVIDRHKPNTRELDHIISMAKGGPNTRGNVVPACRDCNRRKTGRKSDWLPHIASRFWPSLAEELYADAS